MGSGYFGEPKLGNERSSSSRKSKKNNSEKPKQPQRGLGVAQLEKIRLHTQMGCNTNYNPYPSTPSISYSSTSSYAFTPQQTIMMELGDIERANIRYGDSQPPSTPRQVKNYYPKSIGIYNLDKYYERWGEDEACWRMKRHDQYRTLIVAALIFPTFIRDAWHPGTVYEPHQFAQPNMNRYLLNLQIEESMENRTRNNSIGSRTSHISESNGDHELDLELRLSI